MKNKVKIKEKPVYASLHFRGKYKGRKFTITDSDSGSFVVFDAVKEMKSHEHHKMIAKILHKYNKRKKKFNIW